MAPQYAQTADSRFPAIPNGKFKASCELKVDFLQF